jgi:DNA-binding CsgD family transcriptional regulator
MAKVTSPLLRLLVRARRRTAAFVQELRDPLAIGLAQLTAFIAFYFIGSPLWQVVGAPVLVLGVRAAAGLRMPVKPPDMPPPSVLTPKETATVVYIVKGFPLAQIAEREGVTIEAIQKREGSALKKLGNPTRSDLEDWAVRNGLVPEPRPRHWYERVLIRGTLAGGGLIGIVWMIYQMACQVFGACVRS